jgi:glucan phosphoethanolaminetransferase (alkaline phosphatase superfamily)
METLVKLAWLALVLIHASPSAVAFSPSLLKKLYGADPSGGLGMLLTHRGVLFFAVLVVAALAIFHTSARQAASVVAAISMVGFLVVYARGGAPAGPLRTIAWVDLVGLVPLLVVAYDAWLGAGSVKQ